MKHEDMIGISKYIITYKLSIVSSFRHKQQKKKKFAPKRNLIIQEKLKDYSKRG